MSKINEASLRTAAEQREAAAREQIAALEREKTKVNDEWVKEFTAQCLAAHGTTVDVIMPRMEAAAAIRRGTP